MKKIFFILPFLFLGCTEDNKTKAPAPEVAPVEKSSLRLTHVKEQNLKIQDTEVIVKMASVEQGTFEKQNWVLIVTPRQTFSYIIDDITRNYAVIQNLSSEQMALLQNSTPESSIQLDLDIPVFVEKFDILNTLEVSRCRSAAVWKDLVNFVFSKRQTIYFNASYFMKSPWALTWDMESQTFSGIVATSPQYPISSSFYKNLQVLLTPQMNIYSQDEVLFRDSRFVKLTGFADRCDSGYSLNAFDTRDEAFVPRYDESLDKTISKIIDMTLEDAVFSTDPIYFSPPYFTEDDINYAKSLKVLKL